MEVEAERLEMERQKLALERYKVDLEIKRTRWLSVSVVTPVLAALATVAYGLWSTQTQAKYQFRLEAAKSIMAAPTPSEASWRADFFKRIFPDDLPKDFTKGVDVQYDSTAVRAKLELWRVMATRDMTSKQVIGLWIALFPDDTWAKQLETSFFQTEPAREK
jgi:hypothetical protein